MPTWDYWHRIEYRRELAKGHRLHEHTELVEDAGWTLKYKGVTREQWFARYTHACAEDYLARARAHPGMWVVAVWRTGATSAGKGELLGSIRMRWRG